MSARHGDIADSTASRPFAQVDVFTEVPTLGNPVAVVLDGDGLTDEQMAAFARWTNLSETTFLLPPSPDGAAGGADYRLRIFTPGGELPFAGHPTLGSCHAWLEAGGAPRAGDAVVQECGVGLVTIRREVRAAVGPDDEPEGTGRLAFAAPDLLADEPVPADDLAAIVAALGVPDDAVHDHRVLDNGPGWRVVLLDSADRVAGLAPDWSRLRVEHPDLSVGVAGLYGDDGGPDGAAVEVRGFALAMGIPEDPVTGSLNAVVGQWLVRDGRLPDRYVAAQGAALGRAGRVHVERDGSGTVWVGGASVTCVAGTVRL
ncbi:PhzF family phenazine biosynthesis protein [Cellulosimicrobium sp. I38E]|uniref:PhzF family phenazine biosynthesis protein n=1 Tax=Cellulosimicrobium sp. I38E TaxID=1393139 RepID=UPI0007B1C245|nr:PhzF family phenazine biosynthesis protein [Cellulosimicrobium sp. I38E]KZM79007.1 phenazine biosynthesis protein PhzF [Cellulosimicrobium sp. I38E]